MLSYASKLFWWVLGYQDISEEKEFDMLNPHLRSIQQYFKAIDTTRQRPYSFDRTKDGELYL